MMMGHVRSVHLAALPLVQAAARLLAEMATFEQAGVTGKA
jgi:NaMN:DMB phosphoribosyltransferase